MIIVVISNRSISENTPFFFNSFRIDITCILFFLANLCRTFSVRTHQFFCSFFFWGKFLLIFCCMYIIDYSCISVFLIHYRVVFVHAHCFDWSSIPVQAGGACNLLFCLKIVSCTRYNFIVFLNTCMAWCCLPSDFCLKFIFRLCTHPLNFLMLYTFAD